MTPADIAARDQADAKEREWERKVARAGCWVLAAFFALGAYSWLGLNGIVPAPPWSPVYEQVETPDPGVPELDIPPGWEPAIPTETPEPPTVGV